jgi:hypothetical protein
MKSHEQLAHEFYQEAVMAGNSPAGWRPVPCAALDYAIYHGLMAVLVTVAECAATLAADRSADLATAPSITRKG